MDRHGATRRLKQLARTAGLRMPRMHPHMLRHTLMTTMLDADVSLRDMQIAAPRADPRTTTRYDRPARTSTGTPTTSSPRSWHPELDNTASPSALSCRIECAWPCCPSTSSEPARSHRPVNASSSR
jgi:hypothetical protein